MTVLDPRYFDDVVEWSDRFALLYGSSEPIEKLDDPDKWQDWAVNIVGRPGTLGFNAPNPYWFNDWKEWASRLFQTVELTG